MNMRYRPIVLFILLLALFALTACQQNTTDEPPTRVPTLTPAPPTNTPEPTMQPSSVSAETTGRVPRTIAENPLDQAYLRIVHASPDLPAITVEVQGLLVAANLTFPLATSATGIEAGEYELSISTPNNTGLIQQELVLTGGDSKILMITGTEAAPNLSVYDENLQPLNENETRVKFIHGIASGPEVTVQADGTTISTPLEFGQLSAPTVLPSETTELTFQSNGEVITMVNVNLRSRRSSTFVLTGTVEAPQVIEFGEQVSGVSPVRIIHASTELPAIDLYFDDQQIASDLGFTRSTERMSLAAKTYNVSIFPTGQSPDENEPLATSSINLPADQPLSLVIAGTEESLQITRVQDNLTMIRPGFARIMFLNPLAQYPNVNIAFTGGTVPNIPDLLGYGQVSPPAELESDSYMITWIDSNIEGEGEIVERAEDLELQAGRSYLYVLTASPEGEPPLIFSESIEIDQTLLNVPVDQEITPTPSSPTRMRFINANDNALTVNIFVDDLEISNALGYGSGTSYIVAPAGLHTITATNSETGAVLATVDYEFDLTTDYSIFFYGYELDAYRIAIVEDNDLGFSQSNTAGIRIINLSNDNSLVFQLGFSPSPEVRAPEESATESVDEAVRPLVPFGVSRLSGETPSATASLFTNINAETIDLLVIEPRSNTVAGVFPDSALEARTLYDLVIYQDLFSRQIKGFLLEHPAP